MYGSVRTVLTLYPPLQPFATHRLPVDGGHNLYVEEVGNPKGIPVLMVHGGPGGGCNEQDRRFCDADRYRIVLFDQRGAGRSTPHASLAVNTTQYLVDDIEKIRRLLHIEQWLLMGGSWGSTLSLVYAQSHPERVLGLILRGVYLCRKQDIDWFYQHGASRIFPDYWEDFVAPIPRRERDNIMAAYHRRLGSENEEIQMEAAQAWAKWDSRCATLSPSPEVIGRFENPDHAFAVARLASHYFVNGMFLGPNQIIADSHRLQDIPGILVHGRYDMECAPDNAVALQQAWPRAKLVIVPDAGHAAAEPPITDTLVRATQSMSAMFGSVNS